VVPASGVAWNDPNKTQMKHIKTLALCVALVGVAVVFSGCASCSKCKAKQEAACGMKCCTDSGKTCATCPSCSAKK